MAMRALRASGRYMPILPPLLSNSIGQEVWAMAVPLRELGRVVWGRDDAGRDMAAAAAAALPCGMSMVSPENGGTGEDETLVYLTAAGVSPFNLAAEGAELILVEETAAIALEDETVKGEWPGMGTPSNECFLLDNAVAERAEEQLGPPGWQAMAGLSTNPGEFIISTSSMEPLLEPTLVSALVS